MKVKLDVFCESTVDNKYAFMKAAAWIDDDSIMHGVFITNNAAEVWENSHVVSTDFGFALGYLRSIGLCRESYYTSSNLFLVEMSDTDDDFVSLVTGCYDPDDDEDKPF